MGHGQAGCILIIAGAHLGEGEYPEARERAKEARQWFANMRDDAGEDGVDDFLKDLKEFESGSRKKSEFMGFAMGAGAPTRDTNRPRQRRIVNENFSANPCDVEMMTFGDKGDRVIIQFFNEFTSRAAGGGGGGKKKADGAADKKKEKTQVLYSVRWVRAIAGAVEEKPRNAADKRICMPVDLGEPKNGFGRTAATNRMLMAAA